MIQDHAVTAWKHFPYYWPFVSRFPQTAEGPVIRIFDVFFVVGLSKLVNKQSGFRLSVPPWCSFDVTPLCKCIFMNSQNNSAHYFPAIPTRSRCGPTSMEFQFQECLVGQLQNPSWCLDVNTIYLKIKITLIILKHIYIGMTWMGDISLSSPSSTSRSLCTGPATQSSTCFGF